MLPYCNVIMLATSAQVPLAYFIFGLFGQVANSTYAAGLWHCHCWHHHLFTTILSTSLMAASSNVAYIFTFFPINAC